MNAATSAERSGTTIRDFKKGEDQVVISGLSLSTAQQLAAKKAGEVFEEFNIKFSSKPPTGTPRVVPDASGGTASLVYDK